MKLTDQKSAHFNQKTIAFINSLVTELDPSKQEELEEALVHRGLKPTAFHSKCMHRGDEVCRYEFGF